MGIKNIRNKTLIASSLILLSGCTAFSSFSEVDALNEAQPVGSPFSQALANEYKLFSNTELKDNFDYPDALHFARKGLASASGETVLPEPVSDWNLAENDFKTLSASRGRLITAFDLGGREIAPELAARAQGKFDCWIERQEENTDSAGIVCADQFMEAMAQLEGSLQPPPTAIAPVAPPPPPPAPVVEPEPLDFEVDETKPLAAENAVYLTFFNWNSSDLGSGAQSVLDAVAEEVKKNPPEMINIIGHTDTSGSHKYNQRLAFKRANIVKDSLIKLGVDANLIKVDAKGENDLMVPTPDDVREPANRRVNISFN